MGKTRTRRLLEMLREYEEYEKSIALWEMAQPKRVVEHKLITYSDTYPDHICNAVLGKYCQELNHWTKEIVSILDTVVNLQVKKAIGAYWVTPKMIRTWMTDIHLENAEKFLKRCNKRKETYPDLYDPQNLIKKFGDIVDFHNNFLEDLIKTRKNNKDITIEQIKESVNYFLGKCHDLY